MARVWGSVAFGAVLTLTLSLSLVSRPAWAQEDPYDPPAEEDAYAPNPDDLTTQPNEPLTEGDEADTGVDYGESASDATETAEGAGAARRETGPLIDGRLREGAFLSGPGSLTFVLHHSIMGAVGGLATQGISNQFRFDLGSREAMLAGTLIGAGVGFGFSAWWQFNHWIGLPAANYGIVNSLIAGMAMTGLVDLMTNDPLALAWTAFLAAEAGAWASIVLGGGDFTVSKGLFIASGGAWGLVYCALLVGILGTSGSGGDVNAAIDALLIAPGIGAGALALAGLKYSPTTNQILRADVFGAGVGAGVFLLSGLVLGGFNQPTPYVLSLLSSAGAIAAVSILWEESAEGPPAAVFLQDVERDRPYSNVWW